MVDLVYDKDVLESGKRVFKKYDFEPNLKFILDDLEIDENVSVEINGVIPDKLDESRILKHGDFVRIRKLILGGGSARKTNGTILQIAGIALSLVPGIGAGLTAAGIALSLVGGGLVASYSRRKNRESLLDTPEENSESSGFSITSAKNQSRQMQPMTLVLGSHRQSPDFSSQPYKIYGYDGESVNSISNSTRLNNLTFNPSGLTNILPEGFLKNNVFNRYTYSTGYNADTDPSNINFWNYKIKTTAAFPQSDFLNHSSLSIKEPDILDDPPLPPISIGEWFSIFSSFTSKYENNVSAPDSGATTGLNHNGFFPTIILHYEATDPVVIANGGNPFYSTLELILYSYYSQFNFIKTLTSPLSTIKRDFLSSSTNNDAYFALNSEKIYLYILGLLPALGTPAQADASESISFGSTISNFSNIYSNDAAENFFVQHTSSTSFNKQAGGAEYNGSLNINNYKSFVDGFISGLNSTNTFLGYSEYTQSKNKNVKHEEIRHIFHYGLGSIDVSEKKIGDTEISNFKGSFLLPSSKSQTFWPVPNSKFESNVKILDGVALLNNTDFNHSGVLDNYSPSEKGNWITRKTPKRCKKIQINIQGRSFKTSDAGAFETRSVEFLVQIRDISSSVFSDLSYFSLSSFKSNVIRETLDFQMVQPSEYEIRIRKITPDPDPEGDAGEVGEFSIVNYNFLLEDDSKFVSENREGLILKSNSSSSNGTDAFNVLTEGLCSVDGVWEKSRNPAWWFLWYARGGFLNETINSPTVGWKNGFDINNQERLFGAGLKDEDIDLVKIKEWADFCDAKNLKIDMILREQSSVHDILEKIAGVGRAGVTYFNSKLSIVYEDPSEVVTGMFGMSNILKGSFSIQYSVSNIPNKIVAKFTDRDDEWKTKEVEAFVPNTPLNNTKIEQVILTGITEESRAQREVNILAARQAYQRRTYSWSTGVEGITVRRGDVVYLSHDITSYSESGRLTDIVLDEQGNVLKVKTNVCLQPATDCILRFLDGSLIDFQVSTNEKWIVFDSPQSPQKFPETENNDNPDSSITDIIFFSGPMATPAKKVRIVSVEPFEGIDKFKIVAIEEDPVIWAFEYDNSSVPLNSSFENIKPKVFNSSFKKNDDGKTLVQWEVEGSHGVFINKILPDGTTLSLQSEGSYSNFTNKAYFDFHDSEYIKIEIKPLIPGESEILELNKNG